MAASTVQAILNREGLGRLDHGDRATDRQPVRRYQQDRPGELVHIDIKKLAGIPDGGGWRIHGRGHAPPMKHSTVGYRFIHTAVDDRTRLAYSEILTNEQAATAVEPAQALGPEVVMHRRCRDSEVVGVVIGSPASSLA